MLSPSLLSFALSVLITCLAIPAFAQTADPQTESSPELAALNEDQQRAMSVIDERTVQAAVSFLASDELGGRGTPSPGYTIACAYVASRFRAAGLQGGAADGTFFQTNELETDDGKQIVSNVVGVLPGSDPEHADEAVVFSAHLDHLGIRENGTDDEIYNGADDNASGVTGVLSLADAFGALENPPARTTLFVAFWGEEKGLLGSRQMVDNPVWPLDNTVVVINLEMIGRPEPGANAKAWMTGWEQSNLGTEMAQGASRAGVQIFEHPSFSGMLYRASDNWPFVKAGVIAHSFSAGSLHDDYHQPDDRWEKLETRHMTKVIQGLFAGSLPIADAQMTPQARSKD